MPADLETCRHSLKNKIGPRFGINKTEELLRLVYEISRRESIDPSELLESVISTDGKGPSQIRFANLKDVLLKRRFPHLSESERKKTYLVPLNLPVGVLRFSERGLRKQDFKPKEILIEERAKEFALSQRFLTAFPDVSVRVIKSVRELRAPRVKWVGDMGKRTIAITVETFDWVKPCPCTRGVVCCNYYLLNLGFGCPFDCSYCFLQDYQNLPSIILPANPEAFINRLEEILREKNTFTRIGTGEFTDSLALDHLTHYSKTLVPFFAGRDVFFELKTKSNRIENLFGLNHGGKTIVSWSLNPDGLYEEEEGSCSLDQRLEAANELSRDGYPIGFHLDPIIEIDGWSAAYREMINRVFQKVKGTIRWVSLGTLRFHKDLRRTAEFRHPGSRIFLGELRLDGTDGKMRYSEEARVSIYQKLIHWIREHDQKVPIYLCMEPESIWKRTFGKMPYEERIDRWIAFGR